ncbi:hypothetical protein [Draconibacterium orientale]|uniref:hypothetical protein n=1 Tax=Draconibacterium orientale TaxID=1168034 RepID=UPI002A0A65CE|nr:hypothetical protein [Draconibacterium orientale]
MKLYLKSKTVDIRGKFSRVVDKFFQTMMKKMNHKWFRMAQLILDEDIRQKVMLNKATHHK